MQEANVPVPLFRPDQSKPRYGGPIGRLRKVTNGIVLKHDDDGRVRVEKREGFHALSRNVSLVSTGAAAPAGVAGTTLMGTLGDELVQIANSVPHVYAPSGPRYEKFDGLVMTETAKRHIVRASTLSMSQQSRAAVGSVVCSVWSEGGKCYAQFDDLATDTPIRAPFELASAGRVKAVADGVRFWVFTDAGGVTVTVRAYGTDGQQQATNTATSLPPLGAIPWDVTAMPGTGNGSVIAHNASVGLDYAKLAFLTFSAGAIVVTGVFDDRLPMTYGVAFARNDFDATHLYVITTAKFAYDPPGADPLRNPGVYVGKLNLDGSHNALYIIDGTLTASQVDAIANATGYLSSNGSLIYVSWTTFEKNLGLPGRAMNSTVTTRFADPEPGASALVGVHRSVSLGGQVFKLGTRYVMPCYYASVSQEGVVVGPGHSIPVAQPAYFLVDIVTQDIVGELEYGTASFDWPFVGWNPAAAYGDRFYMLPSSFTDADGAVHWTAGYAADLQTVQYEDTFLFQKAVPIAGMLDVRIGGRGIPVEFADELLLPGPQAVTFTRDRFVAQGIELAPESPLVTSVNNGSGVMAPGDAHCYAIVWSVLDARGNRIRSIVSIPTAAVTVAGGHNALQLVIPQLRMTSHDVVLEEIYRDYYFTDPGTGNRIRSSELRKITVDQQSIGDARVPLYNNPAADTATFVDTVTDAACAIGAPLYTADGTLDFFPCPPHSTGCVFGDRVFVGGYDNRVYYSFSKVPGQALAFNQDQFFITLPTSQRVTALQPLDNRLFIFGETRIFYVDGGVDTFYSANGQSGGNPIPIELKFQNGCTGRAWPITQGIVYHSSAGGLWLLTRGLENVYLGSPVEDDMTGASVLDIAVDENQRIGFLTGANLIVYDQVVGVWSTWPLPKPGVALASWRGKFVFADNEATQNTYEQTAGAYDDNGAVIQTRVKVDDIATADVHGFQVLWELAAFGEWKGAHRFNMDLTYDGADAVSETFARTFSAALRPYRFDTPTPRKTECSSVGIEVYDTFPDGVPSQGFALESLGLYCGVERGKKYNETRIAPTG